MAVAEIAIPRTVTSEEPSVSQSLSDFLSILVSLPFVSPPMIWRQDAERFGVRDVELAIRRWADANAHRVYVESSDHRLDVIRRDGHRSVVVYRSDDPRAAVSK